MKATTPGTAQAVCEVNRWNKVLGGEHLDESVNLYLCTIMSASQVYDSWRILMCNLEWHLNQKCFHVTPAFYDSMQYQLDVMLEGIWPYGCQFSCTSKKGCQFNSHLQWNTLFMLISDTELFWRYCNLDVLLIQRVEFCLSRHNHQTFYVHSQTKLGCTLLK